MSLGRCIHCKWHEKCAIWVNEGDMGYCKNFEPIILKELSVNNTDFQIRFLKSIGNPSADQCGEVVAFKKNADGEFHSTRIRTHDVQSAETWIIDAVRNKWEI